jgi:tetratricopeptide (TPR) repeat protein
VPGHRTNNRDSGKNRATVDKRDDSFPSCSAFVQTGRYDEAARLLSERHFNVWEGSLGLRGAYEDVYLLKGLSRFRAKDYRGALADYQKALEFPLNLENAWPYRGGRMRDLLPSALPTRRWGR